MKVEISRQIFEKKNTPISNFMKISPVLAELFQPSRRTGGQMVRRTDITKLIVAFRNFANAHKNFTEGLKTHDLKKILLNQIRFEGEHYKRRRRRRRRNSNKVATLTPTWF
jgi:hypothetical protein